MNRRWTALVLGGLLGGTLLTAGLRAEEPHGGKDGKGWGHGGMGDRLKERLGLSDDQAAKLKALREENKKAAEPLKKKVKVSISKLRYQLDSDASDSAIEQTLVELTEAREALRANREKFTDSASKVLTPKQRAKLALSMNKRMRGGMHGRGHMMGRGGWGGPPPGRRGPPMHRDGGPEDEGPSEE
jgi:Spy/CpxP family protein refolding chaperone